MLRDNQKLTPSQIMKTVSTQEGSETSSGMKAYLGMLLGTVVELHLFHLKVESYAQHKAIGSLYTQLDDHADVIIEACQGLHGIHDLVVEKSEAPKDIEQFLSSKRKNILKGKEYFKDAPEIQNLIDEVALNFSQTLYKIKFLK